MTEQPSTPAPGQVPSSVVIDTNATVKKSHLAQIIAGVVAVGLIAFTVVYFVVHDPKPVYKPGPEATAVVAGLTTSGIEVEFTDDELQCIDTTFAGYDVSSFAQDGFDPFATSLDEEGNSRTSTMFDECLPKATRVSVIAGSMSADGFATDEQAGCIAGAFDDVVLDTGGYAVAFGASSSDIDISGELFQIFDDCGVDLGFDPATSECETEQRVLETAIEAYYADNGVDPKSWDDLVGDWLLEDPSERFEFVPAADSESYPAVHGIGECEGYGV
ncbi:MAG: hypothetical protein Q7V57_13965 [Actinomycetota bacterium]|nr:hypothetical protein [Actinomycetota bacterium]